MLSKKAASRIGYSLGNDPLNPKPLPRTARGSLEIFGGDRPQAQAATFLYSRQSPKHNALVSVGEDITDGVTGTSLERQNDAYESSVPGSSRAGPESESKIARQSGQVSMWPTDISVEANSGSQSHSPLPSQEHSSETPGGRYMSIVDDDLLAMLRISESQDSLWENSRFNELLAGTFNPLEEKLQVDSAADGTSQSKQSVATTSTISETPPEWEGAFDGRGPSKGRGSGSGRPLSGQGRPRKKSSVATESELPSEWDDNLQTKLVNKGEAGTGNENGRASSVRGMSESSDVPVEWEGVLQEQGEAGTDGRRSRESIQSRTSSISETSPEWERVLHGADKSASNGRRSSRQSRQSNTSATSAISAESLISDRGAQWGYEVKLKTTNCDERLSGSSWISASAMSDDSVDTVQRVKTKNNHTMEDRLSGSSFVSGTSEVSKCSWTTSCSEASPGRTNVSSAQAIPGVSKTIKDALSSFQLAFVVCDAINPEYPVLYASAGFFSMTGYCAKEVVGRNCRFLQGEYTDAGDRAKIRGALKEGKIYTGKILNYKKNSSPFWNLLTISPIKDNHGKLIKWIGMLAEVEENGSSQEDKLRAEMPNRIKDEALHQNGAGKNKSSRSDSQASGPPVAISKKVEASTQTSISLETPQASKSRESLRRPSYSLTHQSSRYSSASSRALSSEPSLDLPEWQAAGRLRAEVAKLRQEVVAANAMRAASSETPGKSKTSRFGRFFKKIKGISSSSSKRKSGESGLREVETPFEFSESGSDDNELDTTTPREAAELARLQRHSKNYSRNAAEERSSGNSYHTATPRSRGRALSLEEYSRPSSTGGERSGNKDMGQFYIVHS